MNIIDFIRSTVELNLSMNTANNDLTDDGSDTMGTLPIQWLFPKKWLKFNRWDGVVPRFAMLGNVVTWYTGVFSIFSVLVYFVYGIKKTRKSVSKYNTKRMGRCTSYLVGGYSIMFHSYLLRGFCTYTITYLVYSLVYSQLGRYLKGGRLLRMLILGVLYLVSCTFHR